MIQLTLLPRNVPIWVNPIQVCYVTPADEGTWIVFVSDAEFLVKESAPEILLLMHPYL